MAKGEAYTEINVLKETGINVPRAKRKEALTAAAEFIKEQILLNCGEGKTSVQGGKWKRKLSPEYAAKKEAESGVSFANLELSGDLLDALEVSTSDDRIVIEVIGQEGKAEGNLIGSYGGSEDPSKAREFMPHKRGQKLTRQIMDGVADILREYADGEEDQ